MTVIERIQTSGPKKILALDGGGIRGMIAIEVLGTIENMLREKLRKGPDFVLADYFDFVAGTSTGAIIAACISLGMKVDAIRGFYINSGNLGSHRIPQNRTCGSLEASSQGSPLLTPRRWNECLKT